MNILKNSDVAKLQKESDNAMSIFEKTISKISATNERVREAKAKRVAKADSYLEKAKVEQEAVAQLVNIETTNDKKLTKLMDFLND